MNIEEAIKQMRKGRFVYRPSWDTFKLGNKPYMYFDKHMDHSLSGLVYYDDQKSIRYASLTSEDILATDWKIKENKEIIATILKITIKDELRHNDERLQEISDALVKIIPIVALRPTYELISVDVEASAEHKEDN